MSLTQEHAALAAQALEREEPDGIEPPLPTIRAIDSEQASLPLGLLVLFAARLAQRGLAVEDIAHRIEGMRRRLHAHFVVDTLDFLARGGRIGRAQAMVGKPMRLGTMNTSSINSDSSSSLAAARLRPPNLGATALPSTPSQRQQRGPGGRRIAASAGRDLHGPSGRVVS